MQRLHECASFHAEPLNNEHKIDSKISKGIKTSYVNNQNYLN